MNMPEILLQKYNASNNQITKTPQIVEKFVVTRYKRPKYTILSTITP